MKKTFKIDVDCPNCAIKMEDAVKKTNGVKSAIINYMAQKLIVEIDDADNFSLIMKNILKNCKKVDSDCEIYF